MATSQTQRSTTHPVAAVRQDLSVGLHTVTEFNQSIRYADTKAGALAAVQTLAVTILATRREAGIAGLAPAVTFAVGLLLVLVSAALLAAGQFPRLSNSPAAGVRSRIAFPALATMQPIDVLSPPPLVRQHEQVWQQASDLAAIAIKKYRWLHRATVSTLFTLATVLLWLGVTTWLTP